MPVARMDHFAIRTAKLESTRDFYVDVIGLEDGKRPPFDFPGHWLYCGERAIVHLIGHVPGNAALEHAVGGKTDEELGGGTGSVDHIAFAAENVSDIIERMKARNISYRERDVPTLDLHQVFVEDPNGVTIELNFYDSGT